MHKNCRLSLLLICLLSLDCGPALSQTHNGLAPSPRTGIVNDAQAAYTDWMKTWKHNPKSVTHRDLYQITMVIIELASKGQYQKAVELFDMQLQVDEKAYGVNHHRVITDIEHMEKISREIGKIKEADKYRAMADKRLDYGRTHLVTLRYSSRTDEPTLLEPTELWDDLIDTGDFYKQHKDLKTAILYYENALDLRKKKKLDGKADVEKLASAKEELKKFARVPKK